MTLKIDQSRGKSSLCLLIAVIVMGCVILIVLTMSELGCNLQQEEPKLKTPKLPINSADFKLLAWFSGYIKYFDIGKNHSQTTYLPLDLKHIRLLMDPNNPHEKQVRLSTDCAKISFSLTNNTKEKTVSISKSQLTVALPVLGNHECSLDSFNSLYSSNKHYSCEHDRTYPCKVEANNQSVHIVDLVIQSLEFEIDEVNREKVESRSFSTAPEFCKDPID